MSEVERIPERFYRPQRCAYCRTHRFYEEAGKLSCIRGHEQPEGLTQQGGDEDGHISQGDKSRVKREPVEKVSLVYRGTQALILYLQAYQLILWKQCRALIDVVGLTAELETVVKDMWALRLQSLTDKIQDRQQSQVIFSSQTNETETNTDQEGSGQWKNKRLPTLIETLALCYLACIVLRLPISMGDMHRYAKKEDIPFIRAIRHIPRNIKRNLPAEYVKALDTTTILEPDRLRKAIHDLSLLYQHHFDFKIAPLNFPLLLYKYTTHLAVPLDVFHGTCNLAALLRIDFAFPLPKGRQRASGLPEMVLISLITIVVKMHHPFDLQARYTAERSSAPFAMDWDAWMREHQEHEKRLHAEDSLPRGSEMDVTEAEVLDMSDEKLDQYLDWFERTWVDEERAEQKLGGVPAPLLKMFPTGRQDGSQPPTRNFHQDLDQEQDSKFTQIQSVMSQLKRRKSKIASTKQSDEGPQDAIPIGAQYKRYRSVDDLTLHARAFHEAMAGMAAIELGTLLQAIFQVELDMLRWMKDDRGKTAPPMKDEGDVEREGTSAMHSSNSDDD